MSPLVLFALALISEPRPPTDDVPPVVIRHATIVDTGGGPPQAGRTVVVSGGMIAQVVEDRFFSPISPDSTIVDASGKFLIPGLWDMHVHLTNPNALALNIAHGVTGVRVMWGNPTMGGFAVPHSAWRKEIEAGKRVGPRMIVASNILDGPKPIWPGSVAIKDAESARKAVRAAKAAGADFIKVYSLLDPESFRAVADESRLQGLPFAGHVPTLVGASEASGLGMASMEHLYGIAAACSSREDELMARRKAVLDESRGDWAAARPRLRAIDDQSRDSRDVAKAVALFDRLRARGTRQCPTLSVLRAIGMLDQPGFTDDPRMKYVDPFTRLYWNPKVDFRFRAMTADDFAALRRTFDRGIALVGELNKAGVPILAGTDEGNPYIFAGSSLHDELGLLVKAGLTPIQAIQAATINPARFLRLDATMGRVEAGKVADLVLLDADPAADIANIKAIRAVFARGKHLDRAALDKMLAEVETKPAKPAAPARAGGAACPDL